MRIIDALRPFKAGGAEPYGHVTLLGEGSFLFALRRPTHMPWAEDMLQLDLAEAESFAGFYENVETARNIERAFDAAMRRFAYAGERT